MGSSLTYLNPWSPHPRLPLRRTRQQQRALGQISLVTDSKIDQRIIRPGIYPEAFSHGE